MIQDFALRQLIGNATDPTDCVNIRVRLPDMPDRLHDILLKQKIKAGMRQDGTIPVLIPSCSKIRLRKMLIKQ
jgi:hypothetical protein